MILVKTKQHGVPRELQHSHLHLPFSTCSKYTLSNAPRSCFVYAYVSATWFYAPMASAEVRGEVVFDSASQTMLMYINFLERYGA